MIARTWRGRATPENAARYVEFYEEHMRPTLAALPGYRSALVLTREYDGTTAITVITLWDSMDAIRGFSPQPELAVIEPEARALLIAFDDRCEHHVVAVDTR